MESTAPYGRTRLELVESQMQILEKSIGQAWQPHQDAVRRLAEAPGCGVDPAHPVIAEVGAQAATCASAPERCSWVGVIPGREESAEVSKSNRSPKGHRRMRRVPTQVANAAVKSKGSVCEIAYRKIVGRLLFSKLGILHKSWGGPHGPRGSPGPLFACGISHLTVAAGRRGRRPRTRGSAPQFLRVCGSGKSKWHWPLVAAATAM